MSLLQRLTGNTGGASFSDLGYLRNPFPPRGQVEGTYLPRPELSKVEDSLVRFLQSPSSGRVWAIAGDSGIGKSNFLQHLSQEIAEVREAGQAKVAVRYFTSQQMTPRQLSEAIAGAIGPTAFERLFRALQQTPHKVAPDLAGTALGEFLGSVARDRSAGAAGKAAAFALRWLGGQQTLAVERKAYQILLRERLAPALALPWLRHIVDLMSERSILTHLILLLDEFEDVQSLGTAVQNDYLNTLKGLINAFNLDRLFLVLAGQPGAFERLGQRLPSLATRWELVQLEPVRHPKEASRLAARYMEVAHQQWLQEQPGRARITTLQPSEVQISAIFGELLAQQPTRGVTQRDLLARLHDWLDEQAPHKPSVLARPIR